MEQHFLCQRLSQSVRELARGGCEHVDHPLGLLHQWAEKDDATIADNQHPLPGHVPEHHSLELLGEGCHVRGAGQDHILALWV